MKENRDALRWVWDRTAPSHGRTYVLMILNLLISFGSVLFALITKRLIDSSVNFSGNDLLKYSAALIVLVIAQYSCSAWSNYLVEDVSVRNMKVLRSGLLACILNKDYGYPVLSVDRPYNINSSAGQMRTRVQAFVESIEIKKIQKGG